MVVVPALALAMIATACASSRDAADTAADPAAGQATAMVQDPAAEPSPTDQPAGQPTTEPTDIPATVAPTTETPTEDATATAPASPTAGAPVVGSVGLGDRLYPTYGNGGYDVDRYHIDLAFDPATRFVDATTTLTIVPTEHLAQFNVELQGFEISSLTVNGTDADFSRDGLELSIAPAEALPAGEEADVAVTYTGRPSPVPGIAFPANGWFDFGDVVMVAGEPEGAASWFPVNDHPLDKATFSFAITVPEGMTAAANGNKLGEDTVDGFTTFRYATEVPQASYLTTVMIGDDLIEVEGEVGANGIPIRHIYEASVAERATEAMGNTDEMMDYFSEIFGPYPFSVYGAAVVNQNLGFALETQTLSVFGADALSDRIVAHELAHQWFGNSVSVQQWQDIWLNEGFASYAEFLWSDHASESFDTFIEMDRLHSVLEFVADDPTGLPTQATLFAGPSIYNRGAMTLHALRITVGENTFFEILSEYYAAFAGGNANTDDFIGIAEQVSGTDLTELFDAWLYSVGLPPFPEQ